MREWRTALVGAFRLVVTDVMALLGIEPLERI
jgi:hypothetical protein